MTRGEVVSTWSRNQSHLCRGHLPGAGTNPICAGGIYLEQEPIPGGEGVSTLSTAPGEAPRWYAIRGSAISAAAPLRTAT